MKQLACVVLAVAACGGGGGSSTPDASTNDSGGGGADAAPADAAVGPVTVRVRTPSGLPQIDAVVAFTSPDGTVIAEGPVDGDGRFTATVTAGSVAHAFVRTTNTAEELAATIRSVVDVVPGDDITLGALPDPFVNDVGAQTQMSVQFTPQQGAQYALHTTCGTSFTSTSPTAVRFTDSCHGPMVDVLAWGTAQNQSSFKFATVPHVSNGTINMLGAFTPASVFAATLTNLPGDLDTLAVTRTTIFGIQAIAPRVVNLTPVPAGTATLQVPYAPTAGSRAQLVWTLTRGTLSQQLDVRTADLGAAHSIDYGAGALGWIDGASRSPTGASWTLTGNAGTTDGATLEWTGAWTTTRDVAVRWFVHAPPSASMAGITLPKLPPSQAEIDPAQQSVVAPTGAALTLVDLDVVPGYDGFRAFPDAYRVEIAQDMGTLADVPFQRRLARFQIP